MSILKIEKLTKKYGKTYALNGLDMEVKKGDIYGFVGPNGAGKTTTLRIISGLLKSALKGHTAAALSGARDDP